ncbi:MAG: serine hydrolase [Armatimonadetes bacterium]|nr:serine hydrolase [Armatimonadota bacterium]
MTALIAAALLGGQTLAERLDQVAEKFHGRIGYYFKRLDTGQTVGRDQDDLFPSASTIKTAVMVEVFRQVDAGKLSYTELLPVPPVGKRNMSMWTAHLVEGTKVNIEGLTQLMMSVSDNTATIMLADRVGVENIQKTMEGLGLPDTLCLIKPPASNRRLTRLHGQFANFGVTTPRQMATLLELVYRRKAASPAACDRMVRIMGQQYWDDYLMSTVPPGVFAMSKVGALSRSRSDVLLVPGDKPYVLAVYTDNQKDRSWDVDNEGHEAIRQIGTLVWNSLHPERPYRPSKADKKLFPTGAGVEGE